MAKPEWGTKRRCQECGARFYDLSRHPIVCPKCEAVFEIATNQRSRKARSRNKPPVEEKHEVVVADAGVDDGDDEGDIEEVLVENGDDDEDEDDLKAVDVDDELSVDIKPNEGDNA